MRREPSRAASRQQRTAMTRSPDHPIAGARLILVKTFLRRSVTMLERLSAAAPTETLDAALASPSDVGGVASFLSDMAPLGMDLSSVDPLAEAMARGVAVKQELIRRAGGCLTSSQTAKALSISRQAVDKRRRRGVLLAVPGGSGDYLYPACQFNPRGVIPGLAEVIAAFQVRDPWTQLSVLLEPAPALGGRGVLQALRNGDLKGAVAVAAAFGEQGA